MAQNADTVAVEIEARLNAAAAQAAAAQFDQTMNRITGSAGKAEQALRKLYDPAGYRQDRLLAQINATGNGLDNLGNKLQGARGQSARLGVQIGQLGSSLGSGISPMVVFAQQASDFAYTLNGTAGVAGKVAGFFSGPWGAALLAGGIVVSQLIGKEKEHTATLEELITKQREAAEQEGRNAQADLVWKNTVEGLTNAIRKRREELEKSLQTDVQAEQESLKQANHDVSEARRKLDDTNKQLDAAQKRLTSTQEQLRAAGNDPRLTPALQGDVSAARAEVQRLTTERTRLFFAIQNAEGEQRAAQAKIVQRTVEDSLDPAKAATDAYSAAVGDLNQKLTLNLITLKEYNAELLKQAKIRDAAIEAANKAKRQGNDADLVAFGRPVAGGTITGNFNESRPGHRHAGVDIAVPVGTQVTAPAAGVVIESGSVPGYGNVVYIDHGRGTISRLGHLSQLDVVKGQRVDAGQLIGLSGGARGAPGSGDSTGPHLHFEVRQGGKPVDPFGSHPVDVAGTEDKQRQLQAQAERDAQQAADQTARFNAESARLNDQELAARRGRLDSVEEQLQAQQAAIVSERDKNIASYQQAVNDKRLTQGQAELLTAQARRVAAAKALALADEADRQKSATASAVYAQMQEGTIAQLQFEADNAKTGEQRRVALLALLDAETTLQRIKLQQTIDATAAGSAEHEIAVLKLAQLNDEQKRRAYTVNNDPQNMSPGQAYLKSITRTTDQLNDDFQNVAVNGVKKLNDEINGVLTGTESIGKAFHNVANSVIADLARIAVQQLIIKPIANLLFGSGSTGDTGGLGGLLGSLFGHGAYTPNPAAGGLTVPGAFAAGGSVRGGMPILVGEQGPEIWTPPANGQIIPNHALASLGGGGGPAVVQVIVGAGEYFDARVLAATGPVIAKSSTRAAQGGAALARAGLGRDALHRL